MDKVITFAIPAYNSGFFLDKCLKSFIVDELMNKIEVIIVNDGSTDDTSNVAEKYENMYPQTFCLINKENGGHGSAINVASRNAKGKYFKVVDADDWVETNELLHFIEQLDRANADVVLTDYKTFNINNGEMKRWRTFVPEYEKNYSLKDIVNHWHWMNHCLTFHGITYKTQFYLEKSILLSEKVFYEDHEYATIPCCQAETILPLDLIVYIYRIGDVSQSVSKQSKLKRISHMEIVIIRLVEYLKDMEVLSAEGREYAEHKTADLMLSFYKTVLLQNPDRRTGRLLAKQLNIKVKQLQQSLFYKVRMKYFCFLLFNNLRLSDEFFDFIIKTNIYNKLRGKYEFK